MNAELIAIAAAMEAERLRPVPPLAASEIAKRKLARLAATAPVTPEAQARHRKDLLAAIRDTTRRTSS